MKGIETPLGGHGRQRALQRSDHCPAMKGIETIGARRAAGRKTTEATTAPQ